MANQVRAEWIKARSLRPSWVLVGLALLGLATQALAGAIAFHDDPPREQTLNAMSGSQLTLIVLTMLGVMLAAGEYGSRAVISTYTLTADRTRVILAKAIVAVVIALAVGLLSVPVARLVAAIWFAFGGGGEWDSGLGTAIHYGYGTMLGYAGFAAIGVVIGLLVADSILGSVSFYSEYAFTSVASTLLDPDLRQDRFPRFGSAIALRRSTPVRCWGSPASSSATATSEAAAPRRSPPAQPVIRRSPRSKATVWLNSPSPTVRRSVRRTESGSSSGPLT